MPVTPSDYQHFAQINDTRKIGCFYALDQAGANVDLFGFGPDLEIADPSMFTDNPGWITFDGVSDYAGFHSDGSAPQEDKTLNLFQVNNGVTIVAFQLSLASAPGSDQQFLFMGGQDAAAASSRRGVSATALTSGLVQMNTTTDAGNDRTLDSNLTAPATGGDVTIVYVNDCRDGDSANGTGSAKVFISPNADGLNINGNNANSNANRYLPVSSFGLLLGYPAGMTSGTGVFLGAVWNEFSGQWESFASGQMRRLLVLNFKTIDPKNLGEIASELMYNDGLPGAAVYRSILNASS